MADIRINALATTAASTASDDFVAVDGSANGTRKLNAFSPTFGGNVTASGNLTVSGVTTSAGISNSGALTFTAAIGQVAGSIAKNATYGLTYYGVTGSSNDNTMLNASGAVVLSNPAGTTNATLAGNLTVSGTGTSSVAGNVGIGTTSPEGRLHLAASASGATGSILVLDNPIASALNNSNQIAFLNDVGASYAGIANVRLKSLTTNAGNGSSAFTITTFDGSSEAERVRVFANGNFGIGTGSTDGGQKLQVSGTIRSGSGSGETLSAGSIDVGADIGIASTQGIVQGGARIVTFTSGNATFAGTVKIANTAEIKGVYTTTTTFDFGTIANNDASSVCTLTMTGVSSSDSIIVSPTDGDNFPQFCTVSAVPSGNTVAIRLYNGSGSSRTVGSRSIRVTAIKF